MHGNGSAHELGLKSTSLKANTTTMDLLLESTKTILEIAKFIKGNKNTNEHKHFCSYLIAHCVLVRSHIGGTKPSRGPSNSIILQILDRFESIISSNLQSNLSGLLLSTPYLRLRALNDHWERIQDQSQRAKLEFVKETLDFGLDSDQRSEFLDDLENCVETLTTQIPDDPLEWQTDDFVLRRKSAREPSYAVWNAAQSLFKALMAAQNCTCPTTHDLGAVLCLGTYRTPDLEEEFDFDMFLALENHRQETHIRTVKDSVVQFAVSSETKPAQGKKMRVNKLCESIKRVRTMTSKRLKLKVERGQLWKLQSENSCFQIDGMRDPITLHEFITKRPESLNEKTKRILAVLLSFTVLHFYDTPWLQRTWGSSSILFFHTTSSTIPLKPYMDTQLVHNLAGSGQLDYKPGDPDDADEDDFDPDEPLLDEFPSLITLAVTLMELFHAMSFTTLAKKYGCSDILDSGDNQVPWIDAKMVFEKCKFDMNSQFRYAVEKCLDPQTWEDDDGRKLDTQMLRIKMYEEIVSPLEDELQQAFSYISIEDLDNIAQTLDFGCWGQTIQNQQATFPSHSSPQNTVLGHHSQYSQYACLSQERLYRPISPALSHLAVQNVAQIPERNMTPGWLDASNTKAKLSESISKDVVQQQGNTFNSYDDSRQFNAPGGTQNNNTGGGNQFSGTSFSGPVYFGNSGS